MWNSIASPQKSHQRTAFQDALWTPATTAVKSRSNLSDATSPRGTDRATSLRKAIEDSASLLANSRKSTREVTDRPSDPCDIRYSHSLSDYQRREAVRRANYETLGHQLEEKRNRQQQLTTQRQLERLALENQQKILELQRDYNRSQRLAQAQQYREALDLQRKVKVVAESRDSASNLLPENLSLLAHELPEFRTPQYTIHKPKVVATDPITFVAPRAIASVVRTMSDPRLPLGDERRRSPLGEYGQIAVRNPVFCRRVGANYRDTRSLIQ